MANVQFSTVYDHVAPYLPGAELNIIDFHIRRVAREFLRRTTVWRENLAPFNLTVDQVSYLLTPQTEAAEVSGVVSVVVDGKPLRAIRDDERTPYGVTRDVEFPRGWLVRGPRILHLSDKPKSAFECNVEVALTLTLETTPRVLPDFLVDEYNDVFTYGVISSAMLMPGKPWSQPEAGAFWGARYRQGVLAIRAEINDGGRPNTHRFSAPKFGV